MNSLLQECRIILPGSGEDYRNPIGTAHRALTGALLDSFGGYTTSDVRGAWKAPNGDVFYEPGIAYDIAVPADKIEFVRGMAIGAGHVANEQAIYFRRPSGVEIIDLKENK